MHVSRVVAGAALAVSMACGTAMAAPITGEVSINFGQVTDGGGPLTSATTLNVSNVVFGPNGTGTLFMLAGSTANNFSVTLSVASVVAFSGPGGSYNGLVSTVDFFNGGTFANVVSVEGTFTPNPGFEKPAGSFPFASLDANPDTQVNLTFTFIRNTTGLGSYAGGGVMEAFASTTPDVTVPEPLSLGLFAVGLAGLGMALRRREWVGQAT